MIDNRGVLRLVSGGILLLATIAIVPNYAFGQPSLGFIGISSDNWHFIDRATNQTFTPFGCNYYDPATFNGWSFDVITKFNASRTDQQFAQVRGIGVNIVRIFLSVKPFEPSLFTLNETSFTILNQLIQLARNHGLRLILDVVEGWEGYPPWIGNQYLDEPSIQGLEFLASAFATRYHDEPTIMAWDLQNEPMAPYLEGASTGLGVDLFGSWVRQRYGTEENIKNAWSDYPLSGESWTHIRVPFLTSSTSENSINNTRLFDFQMFRDAVSVRWVQRLSAAIKAVDTNHLLTVGVVQFSAPFGPQYSGAPWAAYPAFNPRHFAGSLDYVSIHSYGDDKYTTSILRYAYVGKPVLLEEFQYWNSTVDATKGSTSGWVAWSCYDSPADFPGVFGLFNVNGAITDKGTAFKAKSAEIGDAPSRRPAGAIVKVDLLPLLTSGAYRNTFYADHISSLDTSQVDFVHDPNHVLNPLPSVRSVDPAAGVYYNFVLDGRIPAGTTKVVVGFRINDECGCKGTAHFNFYGVTLQVGDSSQNILPNRDFSQGLYRWGLWGSGLLKAYASDVDGGVMLTVSVDSSENLDLNSPEIPLGSTGSYHAIFTAKLSPDTGGAGYFAVIFLSPTQEIRRDTIPLTPPPSQPTSALTPSTVVLTLITLTCMELVLRRKEHMART